MSSQLLYGSERGLIGVTRIAACLIESAEYLGYKIFAETAVTTRQIVQDRYTNTTQLFQLTAISAMLCFRLITSGYIDLHLMPAIRSTVHQAVAFRVSKSRQAQGLDSGIGMGCVAKISLCGRNCPR